MDDHQQGQTKNLQSLLPDAHQKQNAENVQVSSVIQRALAQLLTTFRSDQNAAALEYAYAIGLAGLTDEQVHRGVTLAFQEHKYRTIPMPAQIRAWALQGGVLETGQDERVDLSKRKWFFFTRKVKIGRKQITDPQTGATEWVDAMRDYEFAWFEGQRVGGKEIPRPAEAR